MPAHEFRGESLVGTFVAVTPHNTTLIARRSTRGIYVGTGGDLTVLDMDGNVVTFKNVANGQILPIAIQRVNSTGTTASDILALY